MSITPEELAEGLKEIREARAKVVAALERAKQTGDTEREAILAEGLGMIDWSLSEFGNEARNH
jgi:hypothetical protein